MVGSVVVTAKCPQLYGSFVIADVFMLTFHSYSAILELLFVH